MKISSNIIENEEIKLFQLILEKDGKIFNTAHIIDEWINDKDATFSLLKTMIYSLIYSSSD